MTSLQHALASGLCVAAGAHSVHVCGVVSGSRHINRGKGATSKEPVVSRLVTRGKGAAPKEFVDVVLQSWFAVARATTKAAVTACSSRVL